MTPAGVQGAFEDAQTALKAVRKALAKAEDAYRQLKPEALRKAPWLFEYATPLDAALSAFRALKVAVDQGLVVGRAAGRAAVVVHPAACGLCGATLGEDGSCPAGHSADESAERWREEIRKLLAGKHREQGRRIGPKEGF